MFDYVFGEVGQFKSHVFVLLHGRHEAEIIYIEGNEAFPWSGDFTVEKEFDCEEVCCRCSSAAGVIDSVAPNCKACAVWVRIFWPVANHNASIRYVFPSICRDVCLVNEVNCVGAFYTAWHALCKAPKLVSV